jgi:ligand-binding sensor domain-containing protein
VPTNPDYPRSLESILSLLEDKNGRLWIGTAYRGLRYRSNKEILPYGLKEGFEDTQVLNLFEGNDGHLLIATSIGLYGYDGKNFVKLFSESNYISSVCQDAAGHTFVGTHDGVWLLDGTRILSHLNTTNGLPNSYVTSLYVDRHGFVWIGTADGLVRYINGSLKIFSAADGLSNSHINTIFQDSDDNLWVGTNKGLCRFANGKWSSFGESDGMASDNILSITEDHEGSLWVGTSEGLHQFYDGNIIAFTTKKGLADNDVSSIVETFDGKLYFFSINGANVSRFDGKQWKYYQTSVGPVYLAKDNSVWMGQNGFMLNFRGDNVIKYDTNDGIPPRWISAIAEDSLSVFFYSDHKGIF